VPNAPAKPKFNRGTPALSTFPIQVHCNDTSEISTTMHAHRNNIFRPCGDLKLKPGLLWMVLHGVSVAGHCPLPFNRISRRNDAHKLVVVQDFSRMVCIVKLCPSDHIASSSLNPNKQTTFVSPILAYIARLTEHVVLYSNSVRGQCSPPFQQDAVNSIKSR